VNININSQSVKNMPDRLIRLTIWWLRAAILFVMAYALFGLVMQIIPGLPSFWRPPGNLPMTLIALAAIYFSLTARK
jgi:hypothetical protein